MLDQRQVLAPVTAESMLRWAVMLFDVFVVIAGTMILLSLTIADSRLIKSLGSAKPTTLEAFATLALMPSLILICTMNFIPSFVTATSHYSIGFSAYMVGSLMIAAIAFRVLSLLPERMENPKSIGQSYC